MERNIRSPAGRIGSSLVIVNVDLRCPLLEAATQPATDSWRIDRVGALVNLAEQGVMTSFVDGIHLDAVCLDSLLPCKQPIP